MGKWGETLPPLAQKVLLLEKRVNFDASTVRLDQLLDNPDSINASKDGKTDKTSNPEWHRDYIATRMIQLEYIRDTSPALYEKAIKAADEAFVMFDAIRKPDYIGVSTSALTAANIRNLRGEQTFRGPTR